jgi:methylenetetrahydrofolate reductase (NADPH)
MVTDRVELAEIVDRLKTVGIDQLFVPGGDAAPHGRYSDALGLLDDLAALGSPFRHVGIAGYPESHPTITDDVTVQAMWDKRRHATHVVSNLTFSPEALSSWLLRLRGRGVHIPVLIGIPGPVERTKLLAMATKIGVGESAKFLAKNKGLFARLSTPGGFTGERFLLDCARRLDLGAAGVEGLHIFTFNQVAQAELWRIRLLDDLRGQ